MNGRPAESWLKNKKLKRLRSESEEIEMGKEVILSETLNIRQLINLCKEFQDAPKHKMSIDELQDTLSRTADIYLPEHEFKLIFMKMNSSRAGRVSWDELVTHLLLECEASEAQAVEQRLRPPLEGQPRLLPSHHQRPVLRLAFQPTRLQDRTIDFKNGKYMTISSDGLINYWSIDMKRERTVHSVSPSLRFHTTWVTDLACLPDVNVVCVSSTERDLRFYNIIAKQFQLHLQIINMRYAVVCMHYHFNKDIDKKSRLLLGDTAGNVMILSFTSMFRGPFRHALGEELIRFRYDQLLQEPSLFGMEVSEFPRVHHNWVSQVSFYPLLNSFVSCAVNSENALCVCDESASKPPYVYRVASGVSCFTFSEENHTLVTGSPDCIVRVWNVFVPAKPGSHLHGHHAPVCSVMLLESDRVVLSLDRARSVKAWDLAAQTCMQTYNLLPAELSRGEPLCTLHNAETGQLVVGSLMVAVLTCGQQADRSQLVEFTHSAPVTVALYNPLFKCVVTAGMDSCIAVWDPRTNRRKLLVDHAHTYVLYGERRAVEITAAAFDPGLQALITGAKDGSLRLWNFNTGVCFASLANESGQRVTGIIWLRSRILAMGWDRRVSEFEDSAWVTRGKTWARRHAGDVLCAAVSPPQALATASCSGELVLWALETGQAYRRHSVANPAPAMQIYNIIALIFIQGRKVVFNNQHFWGSSGSEARLGDATDDSRASEAGVMSRQMAVYALLFLRTRPMQVDTGTLLVAVGSGAVQVWSHHIGGGYLGQFSAIHTEGDWVMTMTTDPKNKYLFTGHVVGYIKVWLVQNYMQPNTEHTKVCMPLLRLQFPFLLRDRITGRAKRAVRGQPLPALLSSHRAHLACVNHLEFLPQAGILISASSDHTVRLWTLGGLYVGTLGSKEPWPGSLLEEDITETRIPPDLSLVASSTTLKVLEGARAEGRRWLLSEVAQEARELPPEPVPGVHGRRATQPVLGRFFRLSVHTLPQQRVSTHDISVSPVVVYRNLKSYKLDENGNQNLLLKTDNDS
ncbi:WD repeat-containing protein on Y chromosome [Bacillus rossius redtenbacheri]|uniref:WD repeat-containing protein on Y chromosome n=1 Tax=Bacillus rossius redtenbacheri TaxID=93214 RepID=UPI002FDC9668